ncbi:hypothetical protein ARMGADRAFT_1079979 [Armillaria gallica]|uniref:Uncharacterized protein n=1 Tax=Armillaria gallica TaxID=47427 RepID=A0A2H3DEN5_ARMGA|nr:hypothetical protein ARMGADRAFT_1079979 [Armillaria gallica]
MTAAAYPGTAIPELTENQIKSMFLVLDKHLNTVTLYALTHGMYTGVVAVTLWAIASREKPQYNRRLYFLGLTIVVLYLLAVVDLYCEWSITVSIFITNNRSFWMAFKYTDDTPIVAWVIEMTAILSTILADGTLIWRCWTVWGRSWRVVLIPIICTTLAAISRGIVSYYNNVEDTPPRGLYMAKIVNWAVLYPSLILATLLWCTIFIIYRILRVGGVTAGMRVYHRVIEMLVESAAVYSIVLVILLVLECPWCGQGRGYDRPGIVVVNADGLTGQCHIFVYVIARSIVSGATVLGLFIPPAVHETLQVVGFDVEVLEYRTPEQFPFFRRFPIVVPILSRDDQQEPSTHS